MRALTLTQPWAGLVAAGVKLVENRPRSMIKRADFGTPFAIHASREVDEGVYERIGEIAPELLQCGGDVERIRAQPWYKLSRITSAVIAVATIERVCTVDEVETGAIRDADQRRWFFGPIGYVLRDVRALATPVPCKGALGFWTLPDHVEREVRRQTNTGERT